MLNYIIFNNYRLQCTGKHEAASTHRKTKKKRHLRRNPKEKLIFGILL
jgi:hypothetical protein